MVTTSYFVGSALQMSVICVGLMAMVYVPLRRSTRPRLLAIDDESRSDEAVKPAAPEEWLGEVGGVAVGQEGSSH